MAQKVKNLPAMQETQVQSLGWEDPLEKKMAIHSSILVWTIPWTEKPGGLQSVESQRVRHDRDQHKNSNNNKQITQCQRAITLDKKSGRSLPWWPIGQESAIQCKGPRFNPWSGK